MRHIETELRRFVVDNFLYRRQAHFSDDDSFLSMGIVDSTGMLELVSFLEKHYGIHVDESDLIPENLDSVIQMAQFVRRKLVMEEAASPISSNTTAYSTQRVEQP